MSGRVCLIAFDSADQRILAEELAQGRLPHLEDILRRGACVELRSHQELALSASWTSIVTGATVAEHGSADAERLVAGSYRVEPAGLPPTPHPPFWSGLGQGGLRSTVVSPYGAALIPGLPGSQVIGWGSHDPYARDRWASDPPGLVRELERRFGPRRLRYASVAPASEEEAVAYTAQALEGTTQHARALAELAGRGDWDFFFGSFADGHQAGHYLWHHARPEHPQHNPAAPAELRGALAAIYARTDEGLGRIADRLPSDTTLLVLSPYGLTTNHLLCESLGPMLEARGLLRRRSGATAPAIADPRLRLLSAARRGARALLPLRLRWALSKRLPRDRMVGTLALADVDWSASRAFVLPSDASGALRVNLAGREPQGIVQPGAEYDAACEELIAELLALRDSAGPVAAEVRRFDELTGTEPWGGLPDVMVRWRHGPAESELRAAGGELVRIPGRDRRTSIHIEPGFLAGAGPGIAPSGEPVLAGPDARLTDVAATVLALLGVERPSTVSGSPVPALVGAQPARRA